MARGGILNWTIMDDSDEDDSYSYSVSEDMYEDFRTTKAKKKETQTQLHHQEEYEVNNRLRDLRMCDGPSMNRGYVLIIINYRFPNKEHNLPKGNDIQEIKHIFRKYGYEVRSFTNLTPDRILEIVKWYASKTDSKSFVCFLSSHGDSTSLLGADGNDVKIKDIFAAANTKQLKKRPKTFFLMPIVQVNVEESEIIIFRISQQNAFLLDFHVWPPKLVRRETIAVGLISNH
ncbi:caspase-3-like isoform X1 [Ostrea edulis]|uniref:caspase-3-like isoform X1 n=1 Tax=Ostrea edulis TaxID=37623 RepID=UPI0020957D7D|nr:caspase-3-like isoform X1 [Ostrea edulis]